MVNEAALLELGRARNGWTWGFFPRPRQDDLKQLLEQHHTQLDALAAALLERESLSADEVAALLGVTRHQLQMAERSAR